MEEQEVTGVPASPSLASPSGLSPASGSSQSGIANAVYATYVLCSRSDDDARAAFSAMIERFPFVDGPVEGTRITAWSAGDATSVADAVRMALECHDLDSSERIELASELVEHISWEDCLRTFAEWEMREEDGALKDAREAREQGK